MSDENDDVMTVRAAVLDINEHLTPTGLIWLRENAGKRYGVHELDEGEYLVKLDVEWQAGICHRLGYALEWTGENGFDELRLSPWGSTIPKLVDLG